MTTNPEPVKHDTGELLEFLYRLGQAYLACGEQTAQVELQLRRVATSYGARRPRVVAFPTAVFITLHDGEEERVTLAEGPLQSLRLDQMADVYELGAAAQRGEVPLNEGLQALTAIHRKPARFGVTGMLLGHGVLAIGIVLLLNPDLVHVLVAGTLGMLVGLMKILMRERPLLSVQLPVLASVIVSGIVFLCARYGLPVHPLQVIIPPLVTFLPGGMLTFGTIELVYGDMVSGSSRLITGFLQLFLLALGIAAGAAIVNVVPESLPDPGIYVVTIPWMPWVGAMIFCIGVFLHFSAPRNALPWMLLVVILAFAAQRISAGFVGNQFSGFFGTLVATPLGYLIQLRFKGPPPMVTFLPSFWLLVPGALGLLSVKRMMTDTYDGIEGLSTAVFVFASLALGTLFGASLYKWLTERFGSWQLQAGRVDRSHRKKPKKK